MRWAVGGAAMSVIGTATAWACALGGGQIRVLYHRGGTQAEVVRQEARVAILALVQAQAARAEPLQLLVTDSMVSRVRAGAAIEIVADRPLRLTIATGRRVAARLLLIPLEGTLTRGTEGRGLFVILWGGWRFASGPFAAGDADEQLGRLRSLADSGIAARF